MQSLYEQCFAAADPIVKHFRTDITEHDKKILADSELPIIYAARETGTNLIVLDGEPISRRTIDVLEVFTFSPNTHFWITDYRNGRPILRKTTKGEAWSRWQKYLACHGLPTVRRDAP